MGEGGGEQKRRKKTEFPASSSYATYLDFLPCLKLVAPARVTRPLRSIVSRLTGWPSFLFCPGALWRLSHHSVLLHILKANAWTHHSIVSLSKAISPFSSPFLHLHKIGHMKSFPKVVSWLWMSWSGACSSLAKCSTTAPFAFWSIKLYWCLIYMGMLLVSVTDQFETLVCIAKNKPPYS